jgi:hypothetical protein
MTAYLAPICYGCTHRVQDDALAHPSFWLGTSLTMTTPTREFRKPNRLVRDRSEGVVEC